jgi:FAD/FMN-containing dehydrogenase
MERTHEQLVAEIAAQVADLYAQKQPFYIYHGSTNTTRIMSFKRNAMVDVSALGRVLSIDPKSRTAIVEPNVPMDQLVAATLKHGLIPPVVMEFPGITVGGGIQGAGGESSSFRWGMFNRIFNWYEMILANGKVIKASPTKNADLYNGTASSCGTLGILTAAEIQLIPARKYVELTYLPVASFQTAIDKLVEVSGQDYDFVDGIMFGKNHGLIIVGKLTDIPQGRVRRFSRARDQWFYLHAEAIDKLGKTVTESVPLKDYLFRYDRGAFWVGRFAFERFGVAYNRFTRWLLDPLLHTRKLYQAIQDSGATQEYIVQDLGLPVDRAVEFMEFVDQNLGIRPLWLCPIKPEPSSPLQLNGLDTPLVINVGVWGSRIESYDEFVRQNRLIEEKLMELGGKKWFYAHAYYSEDEFWSIYDRRWYDQLRRKYSATSLPSIFDKIHVAERFTINAKRGLLRTLFGRAHLRIKD